MKSLLELLTEEDVTIRELNARIGGAKNLKPQKPDAVDRCAELIRDAAERRRLARQELVEYIAGISGQVEVEKAKESRPDKIEPFLQMLMREARRHGFIENCKDFGISEIEAHECVDYLQDVFEIAIC